MQKYGGSVDCLWTIIGSRSKSCMPSRVIRAHLDALSHAVHCGLCAERYLFHLAGIHRVVRRAGPAVITPPRLFECHTMGSKWTHRYANHIEICTVLKLDGAVPHTVECFVQPISQEVGHH